MAYRIGWFSTGRDEAARELLTAAYNAVQDGTIPGELAFVFCNREPGEAEESDRFMDLVARYGIPIVRFSFRQYKPEERRRGEKIGLNSEVLRAWRIDYDREVVRRLDPIRADLNVLGGYMLITGEEICRRYTMINLHPAEPGGPKGMWQQVIWQLIRTRAERTGAMMHLVTPVLDEGPPVAYCTFSLRGGAFDDLWRDMDRKRAQISLRQIRRAEREEEPLFKEIRRCGVIRELPLIVRTVKAFAEGRVRVEDERVVAEGRVLERGYDLTKEIDEIVE